MGQGTTWLRRVPVIYPQYDLGRYAPGSVGVMQSSLASLTAFYNSDPKIRILDRDEELRGYYGNAYNNNWYDRYDRFNFHPAAGGCTLDLRPIVNGLVSRIDNVPCRVTGEFWRMYVDQLDAMDCTDPRRGAVITSVRQLETFSMQLECPLGPWEDSCSTP
jgi:hypothetical protein